MRLPLVALLLAVCFAALAQPRVISGKVTSDEGRPLGSVTVKLFSGQKLRTFARTNSSGIYTVKIPEADSLRIVFERMSYGRVEKALPTGNTLDVVMEPAATQLREVVISTPSVKQRGDTLTFNLAAFVGKGDVSLEDALKKIPGITVESSGTIKYLGKDISNFYVEGLEMLGGRYSLATRNLAAEYVSSVEVLNNHKARKMDAAKHSDDVALNIKLKSSARIRPVGTYKGSLGYGGGRTLYGLSGTAMVFKSKLQTLVSVKTANIERFSNSDIAIHYYDHDNAGSVAASVLPPVASGGAPVSASRYENARDWLVSANTVVKTSAEGDLRANLNYAYSHHDFAYSTVTDYFTGGESLVVEERTSPSSSSHKPSADIRYTLNSSDRYISNSLRVSGEVARQHVAAVNDGEPMSQQRRLRTFEISDNFRYSTRIGDREWDFTTAIAMNSTPLTRLNIGGRAGGTEFEATQTVKSSTLKVRQEAYSKWIRGRSEFYILAGGSYEYDDVSTGLVRPDGNFANRLYSNSGLVALRPGYEYGRAGSKLNVRISLPVNLVIMSARNSVSGDDIDIVRPTFTPSAYAYWKLDGMSEFNASAEYNNNVGDYLELLDNPVQTSYRSLSTRSGLIVKTRGWGARIGYKYERPFDYWLIRASASYNSSRRNLTNSYYVSADETFSTYILSPNTTDIASANIVLSKTFPSVKTKIDLNGTCSWSRRELIQQDIPVRYYGRTLSAGMTANLRPWGWMEFDWQPYVGKTVSSFRSTSASYIDFKEWFRLSAYPGGGLTLRAEAEHVRKQVEQGLYKNMVLVDLSAMWKHNKWRWQIALNNLLNRHSYSYTVFNGLDTRYVDYALRGRTLVASVSYTL